MMKLASEVGQDNSALSSSYLSSKKIDVVYFRSN